MSRMNQFDNVEIPAPQRDYSLPYFDKEITTYNKNGSIKKSVWQKILSMFTEEQLNSYPEYYNIALREILERSFGNIHRNQALKSSATSEMIVDAAGRAEIQPIQLYNSIRVSRGLEPITVDTQILEQNDIVIDLTEDFNNFTNVKDTESAVKEYINGLIGQTLETATKPLQIQITKENKGHIINPKNLGSAKKKRHLVALNKLKTIVNNATKSGEAPVDLSHNTSKKTLAHKQKVEKYIYFSVPIRINNTTYNTVLSTEQMKGQDPDILDLYDVHVKKEPDSNLIGPSDSYSSNIAQKDYVVKPLTQGTQSNGYYDAELKVIVLGRNMNTMTLPHEMAHFWLDNTLVAIKLN